MVEQIGEESPAAETTVPLKILFEFMKYVLRPKMITNPVREPVNPFGRGNQRACLRSVPVS